jgi:SAM-dependent methyltransferase
MSIRPDADGLADWFATPLGSHLLGCEMQYFDRELADVFGFNAFQCGLPQYDFLRANRMPFHCVTGRNGPVDLRSELDALPIQTAAADLVVLPHTLEFSANPHQLLREVARILMPEGHVVLSGFNPWSLWGVRRHGTPDKRSVPWSGQFITLPRLKDWMALLGIELTAGRMACYVPPFTSEKWLARFHFMEAAGDRWWPFAGGIYFLHGIKRVQGMRIITPRWKTEAAKKKALAAVPHNKAKPDDAIAARKRLTKGQ